MPLYFYEVQPSITGMVLTNRKYLVYALYKKDMRVHILALPLVLQFVVASILMERASRSYFNPHCDKETSSNKMIGLMGCVIECPLDSGSVIFLYLRGSVILAHSALWVTTFAKRNIAQGRAAVVRLVVREGGWTVLLLVGQYLHSILTFYLPLPVSRYRCRCGGVCDHI